MIVWSDKIWNNTIKLSNLISNTKAHNFYNIFDPKWLKAKSDMGLNKLTNLI
jgi:hypothetical protein